MDEWSHEPIAAEPAEAIESLGRPVKPRASAPFGTALQGRPMGH